MKIITFFAKKGSATKPIGHISTDVPYSPEMAVIFRNRLIQKFPKMTYFKMVTETLEFSVNKPSGRVLQGLQGGEYMLRHHMDGTIFKRYVRRAPRRKIA